MNEVFEFLKKCGHYFLATADGDQPRVRPLGTIELFEDKLYIQMGRVKKLSQQLAANPKIELCAFDGTRWLRVEATAVDDDRPEPKQHMLKAYPMLAGRYQPDDGNIQVLYLKNAIATFYTMTDPPVEIRF